MESATGKSGSRRIVIGVLKVLAGLLIFLAQYEYQEPGTVYGFRWPHNQHEFFADVLTFNVLALGVWFIRTGIWGSTNKSSPIDWLTGR